MSWPTGVWAIQLVSRSILKIKHWCHLDTRFRGNDKRRLVELLPEFACQILDELPRDAARPCAAAHRPGQRPAPQLFRRDLQFVEAHIAIDHRQILVLAAVMKAQPQAEAV